jgi:mRNA interferase MazF
VICDFGDVVIVPFPFADAPGSKRRPAAILSKRRFNETSGHSTCAMITTASATRWPDDHVISDLQIAGLPRPCVLRWKLFTLPNTLILRRAGILATSDRDRIAQVARTILA